MATPAQRTPRLILKCRAPLGDEHSPVAPSEFIGPVGATALAWEGGLAVRL